MSPPVTMLPGFTSSPPQMDFDGGRQTAMDSKSSNSPNGTNCGKCSARLGYFFTVAHIILSISYHMIHMIHIIWTI